MTTTTKMMMATAVLVGGMFAAQAMAQQVVSEPIVQPTPARAATQPTRQYRSYSVNPARGDVRRDGPHSGEASWRHAGAKAVGHYSGGK